MSRDKYKVSQNGNLGADGMDIKLHWNMFQSNLKMRQIPKAPQYLTGTRTLSYVLYRRHIRLPEGAGCRYNTLCGSGPHRWLPERRGPPRTAGRTPACSYHSALCPHSRYPADTLPRGISRKGSLAGRVGRHTWQCGSRPGIVHLYHTRWLSKGQHTLVRRTPWSEGSRHLLCIHLQYFQHK